ncbi:hypothetical protein PIB30_009229 [Stylosanthes scabra]|uniref:FAR1 domain-containing protein n=1 Tax=Stylosanthes scabra TaxID=79078 RepID=A0ABU6Q515_9FABA|nr:hypothetical protein [Stylosanthes scabra]
MEGLSSDLSMDSVSDNSCDLSSTEQCFCDVDEQYVAKVGMFFESLEKARDFYKDYAKRAGFAIKIRNTNKSKKSNEIWN